MNEVDQTHIKNSDDMLIWYGPGHQPTAAGLYINHVTGYYEEWAEIAYEPNDFKVFLLCKSDISKGVQSFLILSEVAKQAWTQSMDLTQGETVH